MPQSQSINISCCWLAIYDDCDHKLVFSFHKASNQKLNWLELLPKYQIYSLIMLHQRTCVLILRSNILEITFSKKIGWRRFKLLTFDSNLVTNTVDWILRLWFASRMVITVNLWFYYESATNTNNELTNQLIKPCSKHFQNVGTPVIIERIIVDTQISC